MTAHRTGPDKWLINVADQSRPALWMMNGCTIDAQTKFPETPGAFGLSEGPAP